MKSQAREVGGIELRVEETLHETRDKRIELVTDPSGTSLVLKTWAKDGARDSAEPCVLSALGRRALRHLEIPRIVARGDAYILMTRVERETQTRDSIVRRDWTSVDVERFCQGLREFQSSPLDPGCFTLRQRLMGVAYPAVRLVLTLPRSVRAGLLSRRQAIRLARLAAAYCAARARFSNSSTHYDLNTFNYAFCANGKMSMLDFEVSYHRGDPLFDAAYFVTIPTVPLKEWAIQERVLSRQLALLAGQPSLALRLRVILIVCCLTRALRFVDQPAKRRAYEESLAMLMSDERYGRWYASLTHT